MADDIEISTTGDMFDYCPFTPPDPWHSSIRKFINVKHGYLANCRLHEDLLPITKIENGAIIIKKGHEAFKCKARYIDENKYDVTDWKTIDTNQFNCGDFVETNCTSDNRTNRFIHKQISEINSTKPTSLNSEENPDVHIIIIDSVASTQIIRALPRTVNFLLHGMDAVEFRKFNKVGSNSRPNAFALLFDLNLSTITVVVDNSDFLSKISTEYCMDNLAIGFSVGRAKPVWVVEA
ncbi:hypothetical protein DICVIV_04677 [Dictyocaulus viviparus]|uniref:Uncharacterized protein n=1 Tax=Dictyocaulus viviparus TaxID=29172 RepID=A0A0D8Y3Q0_DICVI|nr:hypothetical protein DICVIV_04677 [Dictyocaulus viviparus]